MWGLEFLEFFYFFVLGGLVFFLSYFLSFLMFLEMSYLVNLMIWMFNSGLMLNKSVFLMYLISVAVGATIGLSLLVSESRSSSKQFLINQVGLNQVI